MAIPKDKIEDLLDEFSFENTHLMMAVVQWCWDRDVEPPSIGMLRKEGRRLLSDLADNPDSVLMECGGLRAFRFKNELNVECFGLEFIGVSVKSDSL